MTDYRIIDGSSFYSKSYIGSVFFRNDRLKEHISLKKWIFITFIEMLVGVELLESIVTTGSVEPYRTIKKDDSSEFGAELHLNLHIPTGIVTNMCRRFILEVLYYKYYWQYLIFDRVGDPHINGKEKIIDCTRTRFRAKKSLFYQMIALRRVYNLAWIIFNISIDILVYYLSSSIDAAILSGIAIETLRRLLLRI